MNTICFFYRFPIIGIVQNHANQLYQHKLLGSYPRDDTRKKPG